MDKNKRTSQDYPQAGLSKKQLEVREAAESSFFIFVRLVAPWLELGHVHYDMCTWMQKNYESGVSHQLLLLPRGHLKSTLSYLWVCWRIVKNPAITCLYASASHKLAELQAAAIQAILEGPEVSLYWPTLVSQDEGRREVWRAHEFSVDHPLRKQLGVRDFTVRAVAIGHNVTGSHASLIVLDDVVAPEAEQHSPWTSEGRQKLETYYSFMTSVLNPGGEILGIGTRYHAKDLYNKLMQAQTPYYDEEGNLQENKRLFICQVKTVEENGQFLWPRRIGRDGSWYGFNWDTLNKIRAGYLDKSKFFSQYYQNPIDPESQQFTKNFGYYDKEKLDFNGNRWYLKNEYGTRIPLNVYTAVDIASTANKDSDYTAVVTIGVDPENRRYILDIDRFQTERISTIIDSIFKCFDRWRFKRVRIEVIAAQRFVYTELRDQMRYRNVFFGVDEYRPSVAQGKKQERLLSVLEPLYANGLMFHFRGGLCEILEEELVMDHPPHDDIADALAMVSETCERPHPGAFNQLRNENNIIKFHPRFGGVAVA